MGSPTQDADGHPIPMFVPGTSRIQNWRATRGLHDWLSGTYVVKE